MHSHDKLFLHSLKCYFGVYNPLVSAESVRHSGAYIVLYILQDYLTCTGSLHQWYNPEEYGLMNPMDLRGSHYRTTTKWFYEKNDEVWNNSDLWKLNDVKQSFTYFMEYKVNLMILYGFWNGLIS